MKLNISFPANGSQKLIDIEDDRKVRVFMEKRMGQEVAGDSVGDEFKGYIFRITGGNDKQGFPMKQGVMHPTRVRLLLADGHSCYRPRRTGERKRKSVRGCIVGMDLAVLALSVVKQGDADIPGLTDTVHPKRLGPKRATKIRRFFGLSKEDDVSSTLLLFASPPPCINCCGGLSLSFKTLNADCETRFVNLSFAVRSSQRRRVPSHTQSLLASNASSHHNVSSTRDIVSHSSDDRPRLARTLP